ncbi:dual specificity protein phosphatase 18-like [Hyperolius riggenbachi]|uniref:dual specificity protein phosphatase 18-like n=1 Tax=Hyperolius riggenbachi TaxID=752182 RepID=UPI0035A2F1CD
MDAGPGARQPTMFYIRRPRLFSKLIKVTKCLYISNEEAARNKTLLRTHRITCIINVCLDRPTGTPPVSEYLHFPVEDIAEAPLCDYFDTIADKIQEVGASGGRTLVHCVAGISRSATVCLAYLMKHRRMSLLEAHARLKERRPMIYPNIGFWRQLIDYELALFGKNTVHLMKSPVGIIPSIYEKQTKNMIGLHDGNAEDAMNI